jgi:hypothetical protein
MRKRHLVAPLVLLLGAAIVPATASTGTTTPDRAFNTPIVVDDDSANFTGEPSITVAPDGTEYIVAPDGPGVRVPAVAPGGGSGLGGSLIYRSDDHGKTWSFLGSYDVPTGGGDTDIAVTPNGTLYASGLSYAACSTIAVSTDKGDTWLPNPLAGCGKTPLSNDRQWTATFGNNTVYTAIGDTSAGNVDLVRSTIDSPAVVPSQTMELDTGGDYQWPGTVAVDQKNGTAYTVWSTQGDPNDCDGTPGGTDCDNNASAGSITPDQVKISAVPDGVTTAPTPVVVSTTPFDTFDSFVVDAVDKAGNVYVVWNERHPDVGQTWTMLSVSHDAAKTWSTPVKVEQAPNTTVFPWVTAGDDGRIAVSYYGTNATGPSPQNVPADAKWNVFSSFSTDGGQTFSEYQTSGVMNVGTICTSGTGCASGARNLLDFFETAYDAKGCLVTSFADNSDPSAGAAKVSYVRQTGGPGLLAGSDCSA